MQPDDPLPIDLGGLDPSGIVADVVGHPPMSRLLTAARQRGCFVQPGTHMMDAQIAPMAGFLGLERGDWSAEAIARLAGDGGRT